MLSHMPMIWQLVVFDGKTWDEVKKYTTDGMGAIKNWLDSSKPKLSLNISKTNYTAFSFTSAN